MWFRRRPRGGEPRRSESNALPTNTPPVLLPPTEVGHLAAAGLDNQIRAAIRPDTLWEGSVPAYTAAQAVHTLATLRVDTARLPALPPPPLEPVASAATIASGALRAALVLSGRTSRDAVRDDRSYVAYDMTRRLGLLAESVSQARTWSGATSMAMWAGQVAEWSGFEVSTSEADGFASLAPLIEDLRRLRPLPQADPTAAALRIIEPVLVGVMQRALRWAVVSAVVLLRPNTDPAGLDLALPRAAGLRLTPAAPAIDTLGALDPRLRRHYDALRRVEGALAREVGPSKRAGGHMDVRPDEAMVDGLLWRSATSTAVVTLLGRCLLTGRSGALASLAHDAYDMVEAVAAADAWPDDAVRSLRMATDLSLILTASCL